MTEAMHCNEICVSCSMVRKNLSELDEIRTYFSHKLSAPVFSVPGEQKQNTVDREVHRDSDLDTQQLLQKSNQLVGEVNDIIKSKPIIKADVSSNCFRCLL